MFKKFFKSFKYGQKGFTLIELLVVVAILGVLAAVAIPNVGKFIGKGKVEAANTEYATVQTAIAAAQADSPAALTISDNMTAGQVSAAVQPYIQNPLMYDYTVGFDAATGNITVVGVDGGSSKANSAGLMWSAAQAKWVKLVAAP